MTHSDESTTNENGEAGSRVVAEAMRTSLVTITPDTYVASARRLAGRYRAEYLIVLDDGSLAGIVSQADLARGNRTGLVRDCMSSPVYCVGPDTTLAEAAGIMEEKGVGCLPVISTSFLVGIVTLDDLRRAGVRLPVETDEGCAACRERPAVRRSLVASGAPLCDECLALAVWPPRLAAAN